MKSVKTDIDDKATDRCWVDVNYCVRARLRDQVLGSSWEPFCDDFCQIVMTYIKENLKNKALKDTRKALFETFREMLPHDDDEARALIESITMLAEDDPGQWSPRATCIIHAEVAMLPSVHSADLELWFSASEKIEGHFIEHINDAVAAVYPI